MNRKYIILITIILLLMVGCSKPQEEEPIVPVDDPIVNDISEVNNILTEEEQELILKEYYDLLKTNSENLIEFIDTNIGKLNDFNADKIIIGLEEQLRINNMSPLEIINTLEKYSGFASEEIKSYLNILSIEGKASFTDGENIKIGLEDILSRASIAEKHLKEFPNGQIYIRVYDYFNAYISASIYGAGNQFIYAKDGNSTIKDEVLNLYKNFIENNKDSYTTDILSKYLEELEMDNMDLNGPNVLRFYDNLDGIIKSSLKK